MRKPRPENLTFRIDAESKRALQEIADKEHRTVSQLMAMLVEQFLHRKGYKPGQKE